MCHCGGTGSSARVAIWLLVPTLNPVVSRRRALLGAAALALLGTAAAACGEPPPPPDLDDLVTQLDRARSDSKLAGDAAAAVPGGKASPDTSALTTVASEREAHAQALSDEIARLGEPVPTASTTTSAGATSSSSTSTGAAPADKPTTADVVAALKQSAESAAGAAAQFSGYRAGLLGSIAAACTAAYTVALAKPGATA